MTASPDLGGWLRQQREQRSWSRNEMARRLIKVAQVSGDTAMPAATDVAANIYRWERGTVTPSDRYRLYYCHTLGIPPDRFGDPSWARPGCPPGHHHHQPARRHRHPAQAHQGRMIASRRPRTR